jgi:hypothetical protein
VASEGLTPGTLIDGARMYAAAADAVNDRFPNSFHVLSQLLAMSLELALKAYLRKAGYTKKQLKILGHNLGRIFEEAKKQALEHTGSRNFVLRVTGADLLLRQCLNLKIHYTTGSELIYVNH